MVVPSRGSAPSLLRHWWRSPQVEGVVLESIDRTLCQQGVVEGGDPLGRVAISGDDGGEAGVALDEELVDFAALLAASLSARRSFLVAEQLKPASGAAAATAP